MFQTQEPSLAMHAKNQDSGSNVMDPEGDFATGETRGENGTGVESMPARVAQADQDVYRGISKMTGVGGDIGGQDVGVGLVGVILDGDGSSRSTAVNSSEGDISVEMAFLSNSRPIYIKPRTREKDKGWEDVRIAEFQPQDDGKMVQFNQQENIPNPDSNDASSESSQSQLIRNARVDDHTDDSDSKDDYQFPPTHATTNTSTNQDNEDCWSCLSSCLSNTHKWPEIFKHVFLPLSNLTTTTPNSAASGDGYTQIPSINTNTNDGATNTVLSQTGFWGNTWTVCCDWWVDSEQQAVSRFLVRLYRPVRRWPKWDWQAWTRNGHNISATARDLESARDQDDEYQD